MDMRHVETLPGPVYIEAENVGSSRRKQFTRVMMDKSMIGGYYHLQVDIDRVTDPITEGTFRANMLQQGVGDVEWAAEGAGIHDYEDMLARQARDRVFQSETTRAALEQAAVNRFKLRKAVATAAAAAQITTGPDGTPMVDLGNGRSAGPGGGIQGGQGVQAAAGAGPLGIQAPSAQGALGAQGGATNNLAPQSSGGPNVASVHNPASKGGANKGAPQRPPHRPQPQNVNS